MVDPENRGTPANPGLTLGLEPEGETQGVAYFIEAPKLIEALEAVWAQEMLLPFYVPTWIEVEGAKMVVMVTDPNSPALSGQPVAVLGGIIGQSKGNAGSNEEYLQDVRTAFAGYGVKDAYLEAVNEAVKST